MTRYVTPLLDLGSTDLDRAGGKGANLGELVRAGFPVPPGFVVTTAAYDLLLERDGLAGRIDDLLAAGEPDAIRAAITATAVPSEVADGVLDAYRELGRGAVAVRSSATAEDLPEAAFAGQQDTYLNVVGDRALLDAVRDCWASLWTQRAVAYRARRQLAPTAARIAVVVQAMVPADTAGVLFTANPVTGARDEIVVDAGAGLGEAVVSGLVTPDHFLLDKRSGRIKDWQPGRREVTIRARDGGGTEHVAGGAAQRSLRDSQLRGLAELGRAIERHFGAPQDIEWAYAGATVSIVQARPITALPPPAPNQVQRRLLPMMAELIPMRPYPMDMTTWTPALFGAATSILGFLGLRVPRFEQMCVEEDGVVVRFEPPTPRPTPRVLLAPARLLRQAWRHDPARWQSDPLVTHVQARTRALAARDLQAMPWPELLTTLADALALPQALGELRIRYLPRALLAALALRLLLVPLRRSDRFATLLSGVETKTTETNRALAALAERIRSDPALSEIFATHEPADLPAVVADRHPFSDELETFLDRYGYRETMALAATQPPWRDAPAVVLGMLKGLAAAGPAPPARPPAEAVRDELLAHPLLRVPPLRSLLLRLLRQAGRFTQVREDTHFYGTMPISVVHRIMLESGRRMVDAGVLDTAADVFHLRLEEIEGAAAAWPPGPQLSHQLRELVQRRAARRAALAGTPMVDTATPREAGGDVLLSGTSGSRGAAQGPVRIIRDVSEFSRLRSGEVLVAPYTNPAWTPLFQYAAAVVVDSGGAGSHAAIVAREYGIPAVMGTGDGTRRLRDGQPVQVDGNRGVVTL
ncbi:MAG: phosphoenolpyruvate synthase [Pseudonocardiaceae bacterium]|nr:phosphoenolpyruvate synthase [Pseudonocardiaceae bacterium]